MSRVSAGFWIAAGLLLLLASALQSSVAHRLYAAGGQPDFPLTVALVAAALGGPSAGAIFGFGAGLATGALAGDTVGTWVVSRTLAGAATGNAVTRWLRPGVLIAVAATVAGTWLAGLLTALSFPRLGFGRVLAATLVASGWNLLFALPVAALLRRLAPADDAPGLPRS